MAGRPRSFNRDAALDLARDAFWERGYAGTSIAHLTDAMGIAPPSLYAAFGDKRRLFDEATARYLDDLDQGLRSGLAAPVTSEAIERLLRDSAEHHTARTSPRGCLVMSEPMLVDERRKARDAIRARIQRGVDEGDLPADTDAGGLADFIDVEIAGMSARARDGATREQLDASIERALAALPRRPPTRS